MPLIPYHPFRDLGGWFDDEDWADIWRWPERLLKGGQRGPLMRTPRINVYEDSGNVVAEVELPGVDPKNIDVEVKNDMIKVEAKAEQKQEEKRKGYYRQEMSRGYYKRVIPLPVDVQEAKAQADYEQGVLKVVVPKVALAEKPEKKVKVNVKTKTA